MNSIFAPAGPAAHSIARFGWFALGVFAVISVVMWVLLRLAIRREGTLDEHAPWDAPANLSWVWLGGLVVPTVTLGVMFVVSLVTMSAVPSTAHHTMSTADMPMPETVVPEIQVIGRQWWWEVRYPGNGPDQQIVTANEIHIPIGRPVDIQLISRDVIHSFWVPRLHGKVDLIPGVDNHITLQADEPGLYGGACAEFCGTQHAHMLLLVSADSPVDFDAWRARQRAVAGTPTTPDAERGEALFLQHECSYCHAIRGTEAKGSLGPDLTHIGARHALAANAFVNNTANLTAWVTHAQSLKPGSTMPDMTAFTGDELHDLVQYLQALR